LDFFLASSGAVEVVVDDEAALELVALELVALELVALEVALEVVLGAALEVVLGAAFDVEAFFAAWRVLGLGLGVSSGSGNSSSSSSSVSTVNLDCRRLGKGEGLARTEGLYASSSLSSTKWTAGPLATGIFSTLSLMSSTKWTAGPLVTGIFSTLSLLSFELAGS
jgi:hypothetical protein